MALRNDYCSKIFGSCNPLYSQINFAGKMSLCRKILTFGAPQNYAPTTPLAYTQQSRNSAISKSTEIFGLKWRLKSSCFVDEFIFGLSFLHIFMANENGCKQRNGMCKLCWLKKVLFSDERKILKSSIIIISYGVPSFSDKTCLIMPHQVLLSLANSINLFRSFTFRPWPPRDLY